MREVYESTLELAAAEIIIGARRVLEQQGMAASYEFVYRLLLQMMVGFVWGTTTHCPEARELVMEDLVRCLRECQAPERVLDPLAPTLPQV